jgi:hypothetical protein
MKPACRAAILLPAGRAGTCGLGFDVTGGDFTPAASVLPEDVVLVRGASTESCEAFFAGRAGICGLGLSGMVGLRVSVGETEAESGDATLSSAPLVAAGFCAGRVGICGFSASSAPTLRFDCAGLGGTDGCPAVAPSRDNSEVITTAPATRPASLGLVTSSSSSSSTVVSSLELSGVSSQISRLGNRGLPPISAWRCGLKLDLAQRSSLGISFCFSCSLTSPLRAPSASGVSKVAFVSVAGGGG